MTCGQEIILNDDPAVRDAVRVLRGDIRKAFDENGCLKPLSEIDPDTAAAIASIETEEIFEGEGTERRLVGVVHRVLMRDKIEAMKILLAAQERKR